MSYSRFSMIGWVSLLFNKPILLGTVIIHSVLPFPTFSTFFSPKNDGCINIFLIFLFKTNSKIKHICLWNTT